MTSSRRLAVAVVVAVLVCKFGGIAGADDAEVRLRDAERRAAAGDPQAVDALEAVGRDQPITMWTDDAWVLAARFAERAGDFERARRDLEQVLAVTKDEVLARRARNDLERIKGIAGSSSEWAAVAANHERLAARLSAERGDPTGTLRALEAVVTANPGYPRAPLVMIVIANGWEREGEPERAVDWLRRAREGSTGLERERATADLARIQLRHGDVDDAAATIALLLDRRLAATLRDDLANAELRQHIRMVLWALVALISVTAAIALRRATGSWRATARRLARPPVEVIYLLPIEATLVVVAFTGNPMVARAILSISVAGTIVAWLSGALLASRPLTLRRTVIHAFVALVAIVAGSYLAVDRDRMLDLIVETWRNGPDR